MGSSGTRVLVAVVLNVVVLGETADIIVVVLVLVITTAAGV